MGAEGDVAIGRPAEGQRIALDSKSRFLFELRRDLPLQPKPIIGREQLLAVARQRLLGAEVRLLTLTGPPGVGKTRIAWELASHVVDEFAGWKAVHRARAGSRARLCPRRRGRASRRRNLCARGRLTAGDRARRCPDQAFPPRALLRRLVRARHDAASQDSPLQILADRASDLPPRQQTLRRAIRWSYDLLNPREQAVFRGLSVFVGGCSVEAAEAVAAFGTSDGLEIVASLVDKSLACRQEQADGEPRLRMLETICEYAREQLGASDEADAIQARHAAYYLDLVERSAPQLVGPTQQTWFARLERERENLRAVEAWVATRVDVDSRARLWAALWPFWLAGSRRRV